MLHTPLKGMLDRAGRVLLFLWGGWAGVAALSLLAALWQVGHDAYGDFILTSPLHTFQVMGTILRDPKSWDLAFLTLYRALSAFAMVTVVGTGLGIVAGYFPAVIRIVKPLITVLLGVPPIAWIILAMIWFGSGDATVRVVVIIAALPVVFMGASEGIMKRDRGLDAMAQAFGAGPIRRFLSLGTRQVASTLFPALILALGTSFKVAVMAELLANAGGIGGALADARMNLDIAQALAWVLIAVAALMGAEYGLIHPLRGEIEKWRRAEQPWGVRR